MAKRLTDREKKKILADYMELENYSAVAKAHGVSDNTVRKIVSSNSEIAKEFELKKEQNTAELLEHMEQKRDKDALLDDEKIAKATPAQLTTALGTLIDKFTMSTNKAEQMAEDPLTKALKEEAERMEENANQ